jgi:hypothetical protein
VLPGAVGQKRLRLLLGDPDDPACVCGSDGKSGTNRPGLPLRKALIAARRMSMSRLIVATDLTRGLSARQLT